MECSIYIVTSFKPFQKGNGYIGLVLAAGSKEPRSIFGPVKDVTANQAELYGIIKALSFCQNFEKIHIYTTSGYLRMGFEYLSQWKSCDFEKIKNADLWRRIAEEAAEKEMITHLNESNEFTRWLSTETVRRAKS